MKRVIALAATMCLIVFAGAAPTVRPAWVGFGAGGATATWDTMTYIFTFAPDTLTNLHSEFASAIAGADSIVDLSDSANNFAFCMIDSSVANGAVSSVDGNAWFRTSFRPSASSTDRWKINSTNRRVELVYIPYEDYIPANYQVISATMKRTASSTIPISEVDTLCATLMTIPGDAAWVTSVGTTTPSVGQTRYAHATWRYQVSGLNTGGYPVANGGAWVPELNDRDRFWDWGEYSDFSGKPNGSTTTQFTEVDVSITNCVQAAVNGNVNNGIAITYSDWSTATDPYYMYSWEATGAGIPYRGWVEVKILTKGYVSPWPRGKDWALSIQTDDGRVKANTMVADTLGSYGGKFTMYVLETSAQPEDDSGDASFLKWSTILGWYDAGIVEVGDHSILHTGGTGVSGYDALIDDADEYTSGMYPTPLPGITDTAWDRLMYDIDNEWMFYQVDAAVSRDMTGSSLFGESFGLPVTQYSPDSQIALSRQGYKSVRALAVARTTYDADGNLDYRAVAAFAPGRADTVYAGLRPAHMLEPRNVRMVANANDVFDFSIGAVSNPTMAQVEYNMRNAIEVARATGRGLVSFLIHDVKTSPDGSYTTGVIDYDEFGTVIRVADEYGVHSMSITEMADWLASKSLTVATPPAYSQPDSFSFSISDDYWGELNGMDGTFVPGLE